VQGKGIHSVFNEIVRENLQNLEKEMVIQVWRAFRSPNRQNHKRTSLHHIIVKILKIQIRKEY
jgi:hypothetical protein